MIREFLSQIDFNQLVRFAGEIVYVVLHGLILYALIKNYLEE